jgi:hypothetical protein
MNIQDGSTMTPAEEAAWVEAMRAGGQRAYQAANGTAGEWRLPVRRPSRDPFSSPNVRDPKSVSPSSVDAIVDALMGLRR